MAGVISRQSVALGMDTSGFAAGCRDAVGQSQGLAAGLSGSLGGIGATFLESLSPATALVAVQGIASALTSGLSALGHQIAGGFSLANQMEQNHVALETMLGSAEKATKVMGELKQFAASTPFEFPELANSAKMLIGFGISGDNVVNTLRMIGDVASGVGKPLDEVAGTYGKIQSIGKLTGETLMQFSEKGIPVLGTLAEMYGKTTDQITDMVSKGQIGADAVTAAFAKLTGSGGKFAGMMDKQSTTMSGLLSTLGDNVNMMFGDIAAKLIDAFDVKGAIAGLVEATGTIGDAIGGVMDEWTPYIKTGVADTVTYLGNAWANLAPYVSAGMGMVSGVIATVLGYVQTAWAATTGWLSDNIGWIVDVFATEFVTIYTVTADILQGVWSVISNVASGISTVVGWVFGFFASSAEDGNSRVMSSSQTVGSYIKSFVELMQVGYVTVGWAIQHWADIVELAMTNYVLGIVTAANQTEYVFTQVIPAYLSWLGNNWQQILTDMYNLSTTVFSNLGSNIVSVFSNLGGLISGSVDFGDIWKPLTTGFKATMSALPDIAARQAGPLEQALQQQSDDLSNSMANSWAKAVTDAQQQSQSLAAGIKGVPDALKHLGDAPKPKDAPKPGDAPKPAQPGKPGGPPALKDAKGSGDDKDNGGKTIYTNSAESEALRFADGAAAMAAADQQTATAGGAPTADNKESAADVLNDMVKAIAADLLLSRLALQSIDKKTADSTSDNGDVF